MTAIRSWFTGRSRREQLMLLVMAALLAVVLVWYVVLVPIGDGLSDARARLNDATLREASTRAQLDAIARLGHLPAFAGAVDQAVRTSADTAGFALGQLNPVGPGRVQIGIASAKGGALMAWLATLERQGLLVEELRLTNNGDQTLAATITLRARGA